MAELDDKKLMVQIKPLQVQTSDQNRTSRKPGCDPLSVDCRSGGLINFHIRRSLPLQNGRKNTKGSRYALPQLPKIRKTLALERDGRLLNP